MPAGHVPQRWRLPLLPTRCELRPGRIASLNPCRRWARAGKSQIGFAAGWMLACSLHEREQDLTDQQVALRVVACSNPKPAVPITPQAPTQARSMRTHACQRKTHKAISGAAHASAHAAGAACLPAQRHSRIAGRSALSRPSRTLQTFSPVPRGHSRRMKVMQFEPRAITYAQHRC